jgi:aminopeptidase N
VPVTETSQQPQPTSTIDTANLRRSEAALRSEQVRVTGYRVELDLTGAKDPAQPSYPSTTTIEFTSTMETTFLDFIGPRVRSVTVNGWQIDAAASFDGNRIQLTGLTGSNIVTVVADAAYSRSGEGLHRFVDPADGETYLYTQYEPADARRVFANFEQPDLKAPFTFVVHAPAAWRVHSNQAVATESREGGVQHVEFAPTLPMSTYITNITAGPYHCVQDHWSTTFPDGSSLEVPLAVLCRASLAEHLDADAIFEVTRQGLDFFHEAFGYPYPWGKYDQAFVPEYNLGAMENPGCVTFTEHYVYRSAATESQYAARANTILHERAHMWFGDLVTMRWWDDLWLKESFADYMGAHASAVATRFTDAWTSFASNRKAWAYLQDQLPTTHPIVADIADLEAAKQNFDGITYAKGASVLKQLVAYVGVDAFFAGARSYFRDHEYANTTLPDLLVALEDASGRELRTWSSQWLETAGIGTLTPELELTAEGTIGSLAIRQESVDPTTGAQALRPHRLAVGLYAVSDGRLTRSHRLELDVTGGRTEVTEAVGLPAPDLVLVNDDDLTYGKVRLDDRSLATAREHLSTAESSLSRALLWSALWNAARDAVLPAGDYLQIALEQGPLEPDAGVLRDVLTCARTAVERYLPIAVRPQARDRLLEVAWRELDASEPGSDAQLVWARTVAAVAATCDSGRARLRSLLEGTEQVEGLTVDPDLRWGLWQALAATGHATAAELDAELQRDRTASGATHHVAALAGRPDAAVKARAWTALTDSDELTNEHVSATIAGFTQPLHGDLTAAYTDRYFEDLRRFWSERSIEIATRLVRGLYPGHQDLTDGQRPEDHPVVARSQRWLDANPDAPAALRRLVVEQQDHLERALRAQATAAAP